MFVYSEYWSSFLKGEVSSKVERKRVVGIKKRESKERRAVEKIMMKG